MGFGIGLSAGLKALTAARLGIETAGQNVANANTPGYSRQRLMQAAAYPFVMGNGFQIGTGVNVTDVSRQVDLGLERRLRLQLGVMGSADVDFSRWAEIEAVFNEPDAGLSKNFTDFFGSISKLQTQPANRSLRGGTVQEGKSLATAMNQLSARFAEIEGSSFHEISGHVQRINELANSIAKLNDQIAVMEANGSTANDLRDSRDLQVKEIGSLVDVTALERNSGAVDLMISGQLLVSGNRPVRMQAERNAQGLTELTFVGSNAPITPSSGKIEGLMRHEQGEIPEILAQLDRISRNLALEFNRLHTTGVPLSGYYTSSVSANPVQDLNGNGVFGDDLLNNSGLPFEVHNGEVYISVTDKATKDIKRTRIAIDPAAMSLQDVANALNAVDNVSASVDPAGRLRVSASSGYGFDFSNRMDPDPDDLGVFGGQKPSLGSSSQGPYDMSTLPSTLRVTIDGSNHDIGFALTDFANPSLATVDEVVTAMNNHPGFSAAGVAANVGGRLVIRSNSNGPNATLSLSQPGPGTPLTALTLPAPPNDVTGQTDPVQISVGGKYTGSENGSLSFVADGNGTIGVTPGLTISVYDAAGTKIASLDAGPDTELLENSPVEVADGVTLALTPGSVSAGQTFHVDTLADTDTSDFLVAVGLNSFFHGSTAADLAINPDLENSPNLLAASLNGEEGDASNLERILSLREQALGAMNDNTLEDFYSDLVGDIGFETSGAQTILYAEDQLLGAIEAQREAVSGVNLDEEMIELVKYQQAFEAASRFINTVNELTETVINLGR